MIENKVMNIYYEGEGFVILILKQTTNISFIEQFLNSTVI